MEYRSRWVCFNCRKSFSKVKDTDERKLMKKAVKCNECNSIMVDMGYLFPAPRKRDTKKWKIMQLLARYGFGFHTGGQKDYIQTVITGNYKLTLKQIEENIRNALRGS